MGKQLLGYKIAELENQSFLDFVHPDDVVATIEAVNQLSENKPVLRFTNRYRTQGGNYKFIEWHQCACWKFNILSST
jgi:PAS domain-containing protein